MRPTLFTRLRGAADPLARRVGHYTAYTLNDELVGYADEPIEAVAAELRSLSYEPNPLSAAKRHPATGELHHYSLRRIDPDDRHRQYHVHLWPSSGEAPTEVHSHRELRPDPSRVEGETWSEAVERMRTHYRPGDTYEPREAGEAAATLLDHPADDSP